MFEIVLNEDGEFVDELVAENDAIRWDGTRIRNGNASAMLFSVDMFVQFECKSVSEKRHAHHATPGDCVRDGLKGVEEKPDDFYAPWVMHLWRAPNPIGIQYRTLRRELFAAGLRYVVKPWRMELYVQGDLTHNYLTMEIDDLMKMCADSQDARNRFLDIFKRHGIQGQNWHSQRKCFLLWVNIGEQSARERFNRMIKFEHA